MDTPRGTMTPPNTLFNLYKAFVVESRSKFVVKSNGLNSLEVDPSLNLKLFAPIGIQPGLLSTVCSPG